MACSLDAAVGPIRLHPNELEAQARSSSDMSLYCQLVIEKGVKQGALQFDTCDALHASSDALHGCMRVVAQPCIHTEG